MKQFGTKKFLETASLILQTFHVSALAGAIFSVCLVSAVDFHAPAGESYALSATSGTILPGGRLLRPYGVQIETGPGPFGLAVSPTGMIATADTGSERFGITIIDPPGAGKNGWRARHVWARTPNSTAPEIADPEWKRVTSGIAFDTDKAIWISEGDS